jgi:2-phospho-L-lactate transferase
MPRGRPVVALCGGVGGAKLALGLERLIGADLTLVVNTGDDFEHLGLHVSPDIDTVVYTLGGLSDLERGWGRADESWNFMEALGGLGGETWFRLGDRDLAMHVERSRALRGGISLTDFTAATARRLGIAANILPMSDYRVETMVITAEGALPLQRYFVGLQCAPAVKRLNSRMPNGPQPRAMCWRRCEIRISPPLSSAPRIPISASTRSWRFPLRPECPSMADRKGCIWRSIPDAILRSLDILFY